MGFRAAFTFTLVIVHAIFTSSPVAAFTGLQTATADILVTIWTLPHSTSMAYGIIAIAHVVALAHLIRCDNVIRHRNGPAPAVANDSIHPAALHATCMRLASFCAA